MLKDKKLEDKLVELFNKLVPAAGPSEKIQGEMVRAISRIVYRYYNDGDKFFEGYGCETAGPAMAFLISEESPVAIEAHQLLDDVGLINQFTGGVYCNDSVYEALLEKLGQIIVDNIKSTPASKWMSINIEGAPKLDMFNYESHWEDDEEDLCDYCGGDLSWGCDCDY